MNEIEIKLSEHQYKLFIRFLFFADYCAWHGLLAEYKHSEARTELSDVIDRIYECGDKLGLPKSMSLNSMADKVRFSEDDLTVLRQKVDIDLDNICLNVLATLLAKRDAKRAETHRLSSEEEVLLEEVGSLEDEIIRIRSKIYLREFKKNGITNLRFKLFHRLEDAE